MFARDRVLTENFRLLESSKAGESKTEGRETSSLASAVDLAYAPRDFGLTKLATNELLKKDNSISGPGGLLDGLVEGAYRQPVKAVQQALGVHTETTTPLAEQSASQKIGRIAGTVVPFVAVAALSRTVGSKIMGQELTAVPSIKQLMVEQAAAGMVVGGLLTHSELKPGESLLGARLRQGIESAAVFATMTGTSAALDRSLPKFGTTQWAEAGRRMTIGALSGTAGGLLDAELKADFRASGYDLLTSALGYAALGTAAEGAGSAFRALVRPATPFAEAPAVIERGNANMLLAADANTTVISSHAGWYDKLKTAIYKAPPEHTIIVTDRKWAEEGSKILLSAKRSDVKVVFEEAPSVSARTSAAGAKSEVSSPARSSKSEAAPEVDVWAQRAQLFDSLRKEMAKHGDNPADALVAALKKSRVVMVGEYHVVDSAHRELGAEVMPQLKKAGLTHLAIEHSRDFQGKIFKADGTLDQKALPELLRHYEFFRLLESAKKSGIEVVPVDASYNGSRAIDYRNRVMDQEITSILENPKHKVLFWVGNRHLEMTNGTGDGPQVASLLRDRKIPVTTFYGSHDNFWREEPLRNMLTPDRAIAVPTTKAPALSSLSYLHSDQDGHLINQYKQFDFVLIHPKQRPSNWD